MKKIFNIFIVIFSMGLLIGFHELGHFLTGLYLKMDILSFNIGFGGNLISLNVNNILYNINILPIGGYVEFNLETFNLKNHSLFDLILTIFIGPLFSFLLGYFLLKVANKLHNNTLNNYNNIDNPGPILLFKQLFNDLNLSKKIFIETLGLISLSLAIFNILPIYPLDGGKIVNFVLENYEINELTKSIFQYTGIIIIAFLSLYYINKDFIEIFINNKNKKIKENKLYNFKIDLSILTFDKFTRDMFFIGFDEKNDMEFILKEYEVFYKNFHTLNDFYDYLGKDNSYLNSDYSLTLSSKIIINYFRKNSK